jgi:hypothetical protein
MLPFFGAMVLALMLITYVPQVSLWLPVQTGQLKAAEVEESGKKWNESVFRVQSEPEVKSK